MTLENDMQMDVQDRMKVSVIIPAYNHERYVGKALQSVVDQTYSNVELIVIDDGSQDQTSAKIKDFIQRHSEMTIIYLQQENKGVCNVLNLGLEIASGEYIAFLASDDYWCLEKLEDQVDFLEKNKNIGMVFSDAWMFSNEKTKPFLWSTYKSGLEKLFKNGVQNVDFYGVLLTQPLIPALTVMIRREVLTQVGCFDRSLAYEDYDYWLRIAIHYPIAYLHRPLAYYRLHDANVSNNAGFMLKGMMQTIGKHFREGPYRDQPVKKMKIAFRLLMNLLVNRLKKKKKVLSASEKER
ncbi:MAG TPA: glycosyltransferase [Cyclobacteriaceae bacterium]|nr:glycosyltransferase [Cyclobacteriaceae bacterium]